VERAVLRAVPLPRVECERTRLGTCAWRSARRDLVMRCFGRLGVRRGEQERGKHVARAVVRALRPRASSAYASGVLSRALAASRARALRAMAGRCRGGRGRPCQTGQAGRRGELRSCCGGRVARGGEEAESEVARREERRRPRMARAEDGAGCGGAGRVEEKKSERMIEEARAGEPHACCGA
jgi:hypothetical protein